jgi:hypothetical protein
VTDEEMAAMLARSANYAGGICMAAQKYHSDVPRLIAEVKRLRYQSRTANRPARITPGRPQ